MSHHAEQMNYQFIIQHLNAKLKILLQFVSVKMDLRKYFNKKVKIDDTNHDEIENPASSMSMDINTDSTTKSRDLSQLESNPVDLPDQSSLNRGTDSDTDTDESDINVEINNLCIQSSSECSTSDSENENEQDENETRSTITSTFVSCRSSPTPRVLPGPNDISQSMADGPKQPILKLYPRTKFGNRMRHFNSQWYSTYPWIEYSVSEDSVYCFPCRLFSLNYDKDKTVFVAVGFKSWKKALERNSGFKKHENSQEHKKFHVMYLSARAAHDDKSKSVLSQLNEAHLHLIEENKRYILTLAKIILFTAVQGIAQRGHQESEDSLNRGNVLELLTFMADYDADLKKKIKSLPNNAKYTSPQIQNEIIGILSGMVLKSISDEVKKCDYFAIMVDESRDKSKTEQLSIVIRYYLDGKIHERFLGFTAAKSLNAESLFKYVKEKLIECEIDMKKCISQTYDGAAVMSGNLKGVQTLFRQEVPQAIYVHCYNHKLNLVLADVCKNVKNVKNFFELVESLYVFVSGSAIHSEFIDIQKAMAVKRKRGGIRVMELKQICLTRWTAQVYACWAIKHTLPALLVLLYRIVVKRNDRSSEAEGFLNQIDFNFIFNLVLLEKLFSKFKGISDYLQQTAADISKCLVTIDSLKNFLKDVRSQDCSKKNSFFQTVFAECVTICESSNIKVLDSSRQSKRIKKIPEKLKGFIITENVPIENEPLETEEDYRLHLFYPIIDHMLSELNQRFTENSPILKGITYLDPTHEKFLNEEEIKPLVEHYDLDFEVLKAEMCVLKHTIQSYEKDKRHKITNVMDVLKMLEEYKIIFQVCFKLYTIAVTMAVSSASCERTFSCMRRLKNYMRTSMAHLRLSNLAVLYIEKHLSKDIDFKKFLSLFIKHHNNRKIVLL